MKLSKVFLLLVILLSVNTQKASASIKERSVPDILYENTVINLKAKTGTKLSSNVNPLQVSIITTDLQEFVLNPVINKANTQAQVLLPSLSDGGSNMYRVILKISGAKIAPEQALGFSRLLVKKSSAENVLLNRELPADSDPSLASAPVIPANTESGITFEGSEGEPGPAGPAGPQGATGATGPQGPAGTLSDGSVTTVKLADGAVTSEKVTSIDSSKITGLTPFAKASTTQTFDYEPMDVNNELDLTGINFLKVESLDDTTQVFGVKNGE